jgi:asparagine synthase (glutamine-hydrolysing)
LWLYLSLDNREVKRNFDGVESLIDKSRLQQDGYFNYELIRKKWKKHLSGKRNWQYYLWSILMFQA